MTLLLYIDRQYAPNQIQLYNGTDLENISFYNRPSQVYVNPSSVVTSSSSSLNFGAEIDEFFRLQIGTDLFTKYYLDYIEGIFDRQGRILKVSSYLPLSIILKLKLNDTFSIANSLYRINSIKTNLLTNKSSLELYSLLENPTSINNQEVGFLPRVENFNSTGTTPNSIDVEWDSLASETGFDAYAFSVDDEPVFVYGSAFTSATIPDLESKITYKISISPRYIIDGQQVFGTPTNLFETTD